MLDKAKHYIRGTEKAGNVFLHPSFMVGAMRYFVSTVLSDKKSNIYDAEKPRHEEWENVVFLPGYAGDAGPYKNLTNELRGSSNIYMPDTLPRGFGAAFSRLGIEDQAKLVLEYLDRLKNEDRKHKKINLVGHSNGGLVALLALKMSEETHKNRHRIGDVVTMGTGLRPSETNHLGYAPVFSNYSSAISALRHDSELFDDISPYYDRVILSLVSQRDELFSPLMMFIDVNRAKFYDCGHYGFFDKKHAKHTAADIHEAIKAA
jgi:pimeloyl-ACP methyl ester carboxylesterase